MAAEGRPEAAGPALIRRNREEHVHVFPLIEVDRAFKNESMPPEFKASAAILAVPQSV